MLSFSTLRKFEEQANTTKDANSEHQKQLTALLAQQAVLIKANRDLKVELERTKSEVQPPPIVKLPSPEVTSATTVKPSPTTQPQTKPRPVVLVVVDGENYIFGRNFIEHGSDGGALAATALRAAVLECLMKLNISREQCRIVVRVYANFEGLSKRLARAGIVKDEPRAIASFAATFNQSQPDCEFIDSGIEKGATYDKISSTFRLFVDDFQCRHVVFAACHSLKYLAIISRFRSRGQFATLVKTPATPAEFRQLSLACKDFEHVFMTTSLVTFDTDPATRAAIASKKKIPCKYFVKGFCSFGSSCLFKHSDDNASKASSKDGSVQSSSSNALTVGRTVSSIRSGAPSPSSDQQNGVSTQPDRGCDLAFNRTLSSKSGTCSSPSAPAKEGHVEGRQNTPSEENLIDL